ncbi:MAG: GTP-binding protein [Planctomycetota bacterium]
MEPTRIIFVGGFLGAGKTTLLAQAAERLAIRDLQVGLITNDQAADLVDTRLLSSGGARVEEVSGSCFCCNFDGLIGAATRLREHGAQVIIAEPVGSCADLSATLLQPLKQHHADAFIPAPLSVLCDPTRLQQVQQETGMHPKARYIFCKQVEEADALLLSKADRLDTAQRGGLEDILAGINPDVPRFAVSGRTGAGVDAWLDHVMQATHAGERLAEIDYDTYAAGEAALGWLNADIRLEADDCCIPDWRGLLRGALRDLQIRIKVREASIGHIKAIATSDDDRLTINITDTEEEPEIRGELDGAAIVVDLVYNARVELPPDELEQLVRATLQEAVATGCVELEFLRVHALTPGRPDPTHRFSTITGSDD